MKVEILGVGCAKCNQLYDLTQKVVKDNNIAAEVVKVEDMAVIAKYGVFVTPGLVIDGQVKAAGKVPKETELLAWLNQK